MFVDLILKAEVGVIQRYHAAVSVSSLPYDVKHSVWEKLDGVYISRFCDHDMVCSQKWKEAERWVKFQEIESAPERN